MAGGSQMNAGVMRWVSVLCVLGCLSAVSKGQVWEGTYEGEDFTITWGVFVDTQKMICYEWWFREDYDDVIEGPDQELLGHEEDREVAEKPYRYLDYARDQLSRRFFKRFIEMSTDDRLKRFAPLMKMTPDEVNAEIFAAYGAHLKDHPEDWLVARELGIALLQAGRTVDAINLVHEAYLKNPELGILPLNPKLLGDSEERLGKLVPRVVQHTNLKPSAEGWLLVAVLMQAQGRIELAGEMLDRAEDLGLDETIVEGFEKALP
ncbi:MAG: hypothetical protein ACSHX5_06680 [Phycisphaerales bacterium]